MWLTVLAALLTPTIAGFGIYIAWRQARTARNKLRLDLFDRRYVIYRAVVETIAKVNRQGYLLAPDLEEFLLATRGARWLFDDDIGKYIDEKIWVNIRKLMAELADQQENETEDYTPPAPGYDRMRDWFKDRQAEVDHRFAPHLAMRE
jgi:hypothetical protein